MAYGSSATVSGTPKQASTIRYSINGGTPGGAQVTFGGNKSNKTTHNSRDQTIYIGEDEPVGNRLFLKVYNLFDFSTNYKYIIVVAGDFVTSVSVSPNGTKITALGTDSISK